MHILVSTKSLVPAKYKFNIRNRTSSKSISFFNTKIGSEG
jgi:hypothetical protein